MYPLRVVQIATLTGALACGAVAAKPLDLYVSGKGNDTWSGRRPARGWWRQREGPFLTLERARAEIRRLKEAGRLPEGATIWVRGGTYWRGQTFVLEPQDSGTAEHPIVYRGYRKEKPRLVGGRPLAGFKPWKDKILRCDVKSLGYEGVYFRQLFLDGERQHLARCPNFDPANPYGGGWAETDEKRDAAEGEIPEDKRKRMFYYRPEAVHTWEHPDDADVLIFPHYDWVTNLIGVKSVDPEKRLIELARNASYDIKPGSRYYFRNLLEELDAPGEWYLDRRTWTLYFFPPKSLGIGNEVIAPLLGTIVRFAAGTEHVVFRGFTVECCDETAILLTGAKHCLIAGNTVRNAVGYCASSMPAISVQGGSDCGVVGNDVYSVGSHGIEISAGDRKTLVPANLTADNNYIHHTGVLYKKGIGVVVRGVGNRISHNLIHDCPRWGIYFADNDHAVEYNIIRHVNLETCDTGAIYGYGVDWTRRGTVIRYNYIHDILGYGKVGGKWVTPYYAWGIYLDGVTSGTTVLGNVLVRCPYGGGTMNGGRDNVWLNNVFIDGDYRQMSFGGFMHENSPGVPGLKEKYTTHAGLPPYRKYPELQALANRLGEGWRMEGIVFKRNIVRYSNPDVALYYQERVPDERSDINDNLIWNDGNLLRIAQRGVTEDKQWEAWRQRGHDTRSVIADPLFVDPENDNYRLHADSPALKLGFERIPFETMGPYESPLRASWPIIEAKGVREKPLVSDLPAGATAASKRNTTPLKARQAPGKVTIDGILTPGEWPEHTVLLNQASSRRPISGAPARAVVCRRARTLYVAVTVPFKNKGKIRQGDSFGLDDGAEVCIQDMYRDTPRQLYVVQGTLDGSCKAFTRRQGQPEPFNRLAKATRYAVRVGEKEWTAEWAIDLSAVGIPLTPGKKLAFNIGCRRSEDNQWLIWVGTMGSTWDVQEGGILLPE